MGNRLGVRSSHTPEKSMAQRQSFPVHKKQQKLAPCVTTHGASFFRCRDFRDANLYMIFNCRVHVAVCFTAPGEASAIFKPHGALYMSFLVHA